MSKMHFSVTDFQKSPRFSKTPALLNLQY